MPQRPPRILVSRTDRIGDVVLTLPLCALLRERLGATILFLGRAYTRPVLEASDAVDETIDWDSAGPSPRARRELLEAARADVVIHAFPRREIARAAREARIPVRIGTGRRWYHWLDCTRLEHFSRRRSTLHEAQLNVRLARHLLGGGTPSLETLAGYTGLRPRVALPDAVAALVDAGRVNVALHPMSHGSAREWPLERWRELARSLDPARFRLFVTGSAEEGVALREWLGTLPPHVADLTGRLSLAEMIALLARLDGFVAASTGPLHVAAATGIHALGLFAPTPPIHPGRWAPLGPRAEWIAADEPCAACREGRKDCTCLLSVQVSTVRDRVLAWSARRAPAGLVDGLPG